ncbi:efflux transporter outer membrane subunit [Catenovulum agarivorans]|uniref:efflux transporter outer membrane subunit n=1 Tax=Catenovulum agarivorans TaxID=1172192 RepID=UPI0002F896E0|nr:efflux transporter outer membrane subunit [Catenovulum agarivorans]
MKKITLASVILLATGCAYQPNNYDVTMVLPQQLSAEQTAPLVSDAELTWWLQFNSAQLNQLMAELNSTNLTIEAAQLRLNKSKSLLAQQQADFWPSVSGRASHRSSHSFEDSSTSSSSGFGVSAGYEVDLWGARDAANASAELSVLASQQQLASVQLQLQTQLAGQYFYHLSLLRRFDVSKQNLQAGESLLKLIKAQFEAGSVSGIEVNQQTNSLLSAQNQLMSVERDITVSHRAIAVLLGQSDMQINLANENIDTLTVPQVALVQSAQLLMQRPDIRIAQTQLQLQDANLYQTEQRKWPSLSISADLSASDLLALGNAWSGALSAGLSMPIFNAGKIDQQIEAAKTDVQIALVDYRDTVVQAVKETLDSLTELEYQKNLYQLRLQELDNNQQLYNLAQIRFDSGDTDFINLLNAQRSWFNAKLTFASAKRDMLQANIDVFRALAGMPAVM